VKSERRVRRTKKKKKKKKEEAGLAGYLEGHESGRSRRRAARSR